QNNSQDHHFPSNFYAEYYDSAGRSCFSLIFSIDKNLDKLTGPLLIGKRRTLYSTGVFLGPAVRPSEVEVSAITGANLDPPTTGGATIRAPVTVGIRLGDQSERLLLGAETNPAPGGVTDLLLAKVTVADSGQLQAIEVLGSRSEQIR